jgi:hypothetical protein
MDQQLVAARQRFVRGHIYGRPAEPESDMRAKKLRDKTRAETRAHCARSEDPYRQRAARMADRGYGVKDIMDSTGISRGLAYELVLGAAP